MYHHMDDHHVSMEASMFASVTLDGCICGAAGPDPVHGAPPCEWCSDADELGAPAPWWHRLWCRFVTWLFAPKPNKEEG